MKTVGIIHNLKELPKLRTDLLMVYSASFSMASFHKFEDDELLKLINNTDKGIIINLNPIYHDEDIKKLDQFIERFKDKILYFMFSDLGVFELLDKHNIKEKGIYNSYTFVTTKEETKLYKKLGITNLVISKELTFSDIMSLINNKEEGTTLSLFGYGYLPMFYSYRTLLTNFSNFYHKKTKLNTIKNLTIKEEIRNEYYPIIEDSYGTVIYKDKIQSSFEEFDSFKEGLDFFIFDRNFIDDEEYFNTINAYLDKIESLIAPYKDKYTKGYYYKEIGELK